jgi:hypothetical protein
MPARFGYCRAHFGSYGALANPNGHPVAATEISGRSTIPTGSRRMCGTGLSDTCPPWYAVRSPPRCAAQAWAASCSVVEKRKTT